MVDLAVVQKKIAVIGGVMTTKKKPVPLEG